MAKQEAKNLIYERDFEIWAYLGTNEIQCMDKDGINLWVNWEKDEFRLAWAIPFSMIQLKLPTCGSFSNNHHFEKMYSQMKNAVKRYISAGSGGCVDNNPGGDAGGQSKKARYETE